MTFLLYVLLGLIHLWPFFDSLYQSDGIPNMFSLQLCGVGSDNNSMTGNLVCIHFDVMQLPEASPACYVSMQKKINLLNSYACMCFALHSSGS